MCANGIEIEQGAMECKLLSECHVETAVFNPLGFNVVFSSSLEFTIVRSEP